MNNVFRYKRDKDSICVFYNDVFIGAIENTSASCEVINKYNQVIIELLDRINKLNNDLKMVTRD